MENQTDLRTNLQRESSSLGAYLSESGIGPEGENRTRLNRGERGPVLNVVEWNGGK